MQVRNRRERESESWGSEADGHHATAPLLGGRSESREGKRER